MPGLNIEQRTSNPAKYCRQPRRPVSANDPLHFGEHLFNVGQSKRFLARPLMRLERVHSASLVYANEKAWWGGGMPYAAVSVSGCWIETLR
jgi:hypothetical protein